MDRTLVQALDFIPAHLRTAIGDDTCTVDLSPWLRQATQQAVQCGRPLHLAAGTWTIASTESSSSGWLIQVPDHGSLRITGDGPRSVVKRLPIEGTAALMPMVAIQANAGIDVRFEDLCFDGNEAQCSYDMIPVGVGDGTTRTFVCLTGVPDLARWSPTVLYQGVEAIQAFGAARRTAAKPDTIQFAVPPPQGAEVRLVQTYAQEHAANLAFARGSGKPDTLSLHRVTMRGCIGDGLWINSVIRRLDVQRFTSTGRTRRTRSDITLSYVPEELAEVSDFDGDAFEVESKVLPAPDHQIRLARMTVRGAFDIGTDTGHLNVSGADITHHARFGVGLPMANFYRVHGRFRNCHFVAPLPVYLCDLRLDDGSITLVGRSDLPDKLAEASALLVQPDGQVILNRVRLDVAAGFPGAPVPTEGHYLRRHAALDDSTQVVTLRDCTVVTPLPHVMLADRCGTLVLDGGNLQARKALAWVVHGSGPAITRVRLRAGPGWRGAILDLGPAFGGPIDIEMRGEFSSSSLLPLAATVKAGTRSVVHWQGQWKVAHAGDPNGIIAGVPGLLVADVAANRLWTYTGGQAFGKATYAPSA